MIDWLFSNLSTIIVAALVFGLLGLLTRKMIKDKKAGKGSCAGCSGCSSCNGCCMASKSKAGKSTL